MPDASWTIFDTNVYVAALREGVTGASFLRLQAALPRTFLAAVVSAELRAGAIDEVARRAVFDLVNRFHRIGRVVTPTAASWDEAGDVLARILRTEPRFRVWKAGIPCLLYGPGVERGGPDGDDSCVFVSEMVRVTQVLALTALDVCNRDAGALRM